MVSEMLIRRILEKMIVINVARGVHTTNLICFSYWKDLLLMGFFSRNPTMIMSSAATKDVKTAVLIFDGSNYNVWVDQMKLWLQSQNSGGS